MTLVILWIRMYDILYGTAISLRLTDIMTFNALTFMYLLPHVGITAPVRTALDVPWFHTVYFQ